MFMLIISIVDIPYIGYWTFGNVVSVTFIFLTKTHKEKQREGG